MNWFKKLFRTQEEKCADGDHRWRKNNHTDKWGNEAGYIFKDYPGSWCVAYLYKECECCGFRSDEGTRINYD